MANFLYNGQPISKTIQNTNVAFLTGTPTTSVNAAGYQVGGNTANADFISKFKSFHSAAAGGSPVSYTLGNIYLVSNGANIYNNDTCPIVYYAPAPGNFQADPYAEGSFPGPAPVIAYSWKFANTPVYNSPQDYSDGINVLGHPTYGTPKRAYFIITSGGGGGGGGGRHPGANSRGGASGGSGSQLGWMLTLSQNPGLPTNDIVNKINFVVGGGGKRGLGAASFFSGATPSLAGQAGGDGGTTSISYANHTYLVNGGGGGEGGQGSPTSGNPGPSVAGSGGTAAANAWSPVNTFPPSASNPNYGNVEVFKNGNAGVAVNADNPGTVAGAVNAGYFPKDNTIANGSYGQNSIFGPFYSTVGAFPIQFRGGGSGQGGAGWSGASTTDAQGNNGGGGSIYIFFYYD